MSKFKRMAVYIESNPVLMLDILKYVVAGVMLFGIPLPPGIDAVVTGLVLAVLTLFTSGQVVPVGKHETDVQTALYTPVPADAPATPAIEAESAR